MEIIDFNFTNQSKESAYENLLHSLKILYQSERDLIASLANTSAALQSVFHFHWVGFYLTNDEGDLVLGPFQGPVACTRIRKGQGVCGHAQTIRNTVIVPDVAQFAGHIACSALTKSEIVVPVIVDHSVRAVLDIDSEFLDHFDHIDQSGLEKICKELSRQFD